MGDRSRREERATAQNMWLPSGAGYGITTVNFPQGKWQAAVKGEGPIAMIARSQTMATGDT